MNEATLLSVLAFLFVGVGIIALGFGIGGLPVAAGACILYGFVLGYISTL